MVKVRSERKRCNELNDKATWTSGSKPPFVVISGVLMTRNNDGKLAPFKEPESTITSKFEATTSNSSSADPTPSTATDSLAQSKKRKGREPGGSPAVIIDAAKKSAVLDQAFIQRRNKSTDQLLTANKLRSIDVMGYGNCLYRAL